MDDWLRDRQAFERVLEALDGPDGAHLDDVRRARRLSLRDAVEVGRQIDVHDDDVAAAYLAINGFGAWRLSTPSELVEVRVVSSRPRRYMLDRRADPAPDGEQILARVAEHPGLPRWALPLAEQLVARPDRPFLVVGQSSLTACYVENRVVHRALAAAWTHASPGPRHCAEALEVTEQLEHEVPTESRLAGLAAYRQLDLVTWLVGGPRVDVNLRYLRWWACHRWSSLVAFCAPGWRETVLQAMGADVDEQLPSLQLGDGVELVDLDQTSGVDQTFGPGNEESHEAP